MKIELPVSLRIRTPMNVQQIQFKIRYLPETFMNPTIVGGKDTAGINPYSQIDKDEDSSNTLAALIQWPSNTTNQFNPNEYEIAKINFDLASTSPSGFPQMQLKDVILSDKENNKSALDCMSGVVFIED